MDEYQAKLLKQYMAVSRVLWKTPNDAAQNLILDVRFTLVREMSGNMLTLAQSLTRIAFSGEFGGESL